MKYLNSCNNEQIFRKEDDELAIEENMFLKKDNFDCDDSFNDLYFEKSSSLDLDKENEDDILMIFILTPTILQNKKITGENQKIFEFDGIVDLNSNFVVSNLT